MPAFCYQDFPPGGTIGFRYVRPWSGDKHRVQKETSRLCSRPRMMARPVVDEIGRPYWDMAARELHMRISWVEQMMTPASLAWLIGFGHGTVDRGGSECGLIA